MTGYGAFQKSFEDGDREFEISLEIKSLNSKYFDLSVRGPKQFNALESRINKYLKSKFQRGRFDVFINRRILQGKTQDYAVNYSQADELAQALKKVAEKSSLKSGVGMMDLLQAPDWLQAKDVDQDIEKEWGFLSEVLEEAAKAVQNSRAEEGKSLSEIFSRHQAELVKGFEIVCKEAPSLGTALKQRVIDRIKELAGDIEMDPQRLEQEVVYVVTRSDFTEEVDRFRHHLEQLESLLKTEKQVGRRLEFLIQEMHRELNTMGSKCSDANLTSHVMDLKAVVDRMREQAANVE